MQQLNLKIWAVIAVFWLASFSAYASHRAILFNEKAMDMVLEMWPDFVETVNNQARGVENPGERGLIMQSPLRSHINNLLREQPTPAQFGEGFKILVKRHYLPAGITTFASRVNTNEQITAWHYLLREDGRLPIRFAYSYDLARQPIPRAAAAGLYENIGVMWQGIESNPWLWLHGMSSEGEWDAPNRGCQKDDLPAKPGADAREVKEVLEICPDFNSAAVQALMRGLRSGWRFVGVHGVGSYAIRIFVEKLEEAMRRNPGVLTMEYVRGMRNGFAHGTLTGAVPEVVAAARKYNLYIPINARRSLAVEPENIRQHYGEPGWDFLAPVKTLLDQGVNVVGEAEEARPDPSTYFMILRVYVTREISGLFRGNPVDPGVYVPEEAIDRVRALKLFTHKASEFMLAETKVGSLEVGKYADFVVLDKDYLTGPDSAIGDNKMIMTVLAGEIEYQDSDFNPSISRGSLVTSQ